MENNIRFRNHISIIFEQIGSVMIFLLIMAGTGFIQNFQEIKKKNLDLTELTSKDIQLLILICLAAAGLLIFIIAWQLVVWSKTYISIQNNTLILERNTLNKKKHTIGIQNISNVNTEQNLFEMILGTCKLKLDTNTLSTANKTDVKIVLKKADAEKFRAYLMKLMRQSTGTNPTPISADNTADSSYAPSNFDDSANAAENEIALGLGDMLIHGFFSINLFSLVVVIGTITIAGQTAFDTFQQGISGKGLWEILTALLMVGILFFSALWDIIKGFIRYYNFRVCRMADRLYIRYGFFKKVNYTIPVDKINALKLTQSPFARITGRYMAEIINVGMGDDESEQKAFLLLYDKRSRLRERLEILLPEFTDAMDQPVELQPASVWCVWIISYGIYAFCAIAAALLGISLFPEQTRIIWLSVIGISIWILLYLIFKSRTAGTSVTEQHLILVKGSLTKRFTFLSYEKIQYIQLEQNFLTKHLGIQKGTLYLLASALNTTQEIPYFRETDVKQLKEYLLQK